MLLGESAEEVRVFNVSLSFAEAAAMLSDISFVPDTPGAVSATCNESESPCFLSLSKEQQRIFDRAVSAGLMKRLPGGYYRWLPKSKALLSYFCGRVFCGDYPQDGIWKCGKKRFPKREVERLFETGWIGSYRNKRIFLHLPKGHELIDRLWQ